MQEDIEPASVGNLGEFAPHSFPREMFELTGGGDAPHEVKRLRAYLKAEVSQLRTEACDAHHPQGVFGEGFRYMSQDAILKVALTAEGIDYFAVLLGHGIDGQVTAPEICLEVHALRSIESKSFVSCRNL